MIRIEKISFSIGGRKLLDTGNITIPSGHKIGVVGRNGTGKTTLFGLIKGDLELESGTIIVPKNANIGRWYLWSYCYHIFSVAHIFGDSNLSSPS